MRERRSGFDNANCGQQGAFAEQRPLPHAARSREKMRLRPQAVKMWNDEAGKHTAAGRPDEHMNYPADTTSAGRRFYGETVFTHALFDIG